MKTMYAKLQIKLSFGSFLSAGVSSESFVFEIPNCETLVQNYNEISRECKELSCGYVIGSAFELTFAALSMDKLVGNGCTLALIGFENVIQQLLKLASESTYTLQIFLHSQSIGWISR
jgi:hypothetical protein